jgi:CubicO group peptidase (beta-lactamase class C family)
VADVDTELEEHFSAPVSAGDLAGLVVGITRTGRADYARAFGTVNIESLAPVTIETMFHMASITKGLVSVAVLQLAERSKLSLADLVIAHLPYFRFRETGSRRITILELLSHTSGAPHPANIAGYQWDRPEYDSAALERYVRGLHSCSMVSPPSAKYSYSDIGFEILGDIIAKASGMSFEAYMVEHVLRPLGMTASVFCAPHAPGAVLAQPHVRSDNGTRAVSQVYPYHRAHAPSSTLASTVLDMNRCALGLMRRTGGGRPHLLSEASYDRMWRPVVPVSTASWMGLGWFGRGSGDAIQLYLNGSDLGFATHLSLYPSLGVSIVVMANCDWAKPSRIAARAVEIMLST